MIWLAVVLVLTLACGGAEDSTTQTAVEDAVEQVAEVASKAIAGGGEVDETWPFTHREVDAIRITSAVEDLVKQTLLETITEYVRPDRMRDVTTTVSGPGEAPTVVERVHTSESTYLRIGDRLITAASTQDTEVGVEDTLRLHTSAGRLEDAHKMRQFMLELEGREELDGMEMLVYRQDDLDVILEGEQVKGSSRTWVGAEDGLVYKRVQEAQSETAHQRSTTTYEYGDSVTIEIPEE